MVVFANVALGQEPHGQCWKEKKNTLPSKLILFLVFFHGISTNEKMVRLTSSDYHRSRTLSRSKSVLLPSEQILQKGSYGGGVDGIHL